MIIPSVSAAATRRARSKDRGKRRRFLTPGQDMRRGPALAHVLLLAAFWVGLWGTISPATVVSGLVLGVALRHLRGRRSTWQVHPVGAARALAVIGWNILVANVAMARAVIVGPDRVQEHDVQVALTRLGAPLDALLALAVTVTPGTIASDITRRDGLPSVLHVHALAASPTEVAESVRRIEASIDGAISVHDVPDYDRRPTARPSARTTVATLEPPQ